MLRGVLLIFLTLVLWSARSFASPHSDSPPAKVEEEVGKKPSQFAVDNMTVTKPKKRKPRKIIDIARRFSKKDYYYAFHHSVRAFGGVNYLITDSTEDEDDFHYSLGASYEYLTGDSKSWEAEAMWTTYSLGGLSAFRKRIFNEKGSFRPFYRWGLTYKVVPEENLASATNFENFLIRIGIGFADMIKPPKSMRFDVDVAVGSEDTWIMAFFAYEWGWRD